MVHRVYLLVLVLAASMDRSGRSGLPAVRGDGFAIPARLASQVSAVVL